MTIDYTRHIGPDHTPDAGTVTFTPATEPPPYEPGEDSSMLEQWAQQPGNICDHVDAGGQAGVINNTARITAIEGRPELVGHLFEWVE